MKKSDWKKLDFKPKVLSKEYLEEHGVLYNDDFYQDDYQLEALYDKAPELGGKPFTGLLYELYNDTLIYYQFFKDGFGDGESVRFYDTGELEYYCIEKKGSASLIVYEWFINGKLKYYREVNKKRQTVNAIRYDEEGNIVLLIEKGVTKV